jgi:hypothetical protein
MFTMAACRRISLGAVIYTVDTKLWNGPLWFTIMHHTLAGIYAVAVHWGMDELDAHEIYSNLVKPVIASEHIMHSIRRQYLSLQKIWLRLLMLRPVTALSVLDHYSPEPQAEWKPQAESKPQAEWKPPTTDDWIQSWREYLILSRLPLDAHHFVWPDSEPDCTIWGSKRTWSCHVHILGTYSSVLMESLHKHNGRVDIIDMPGWVIQMTLQWMYSPAQVRLDHDRIGSHHMSSRTRYEHTLSILPCDRIIRLVPRDMSVLFVMAKRWKIQSLMHMITTELLSAHQMTSVTIDHWTRTAQYMVRDSPGDMDELLIRCYLYALKHSSECVHTKTLHDARLVLDSYLWGLGVQMI